MPIDTFLLGSLSICHRVCKTDRPRGEGGMISKRFWGAAITRTGSRSGDIHIQKPLCMQMLTTSSEMFLGPAHKDFNFQPKHKSNSYEIEAEG